MSIKLISGEVRALFAQHFADQVLDAVLTKSTNGTRTTSTGGTNPAPTDYECSGFVGSFEESAIDGTLVRTSDRVVKIFGGTLPDGVQPEVDDSITIEDPPDTGVIRTFRIIGGRDGKGVFKRDPVGALHSCHCREV